MASNPHRQRSMSIATVHLDPDDLSELPRADYMQSDRMDTTASSDSDKNKFRIFLAVLIVAFTIIALISIAGLIIASYSLSIIRSRDANYNTANSDTTTVSSSSTTAPQCSASPATYFSYTTITPPQCLNYTTNADSTRNIGYTSSINYCDNIAPFSNATSVWIRFREPAGTLVANSPVPPNSCGTVVTGWYAGQYPSTVFTTATSVVCFYYSTDTCSSCAAISITNCLNFYVFLLPQANTCNYRYCTL